MSIVLFLGILLVHSPNAVSQENAAADKLQGQLKALEKIREAKARVEVEQLKLQIQAINERRGGVVAPLQLNVMPAMPLAPANNVQMENNRVQVYKFMRGLIQNELSVIDQLCGLERDQKQQLVDLAEDQWKDKTKPSLDKCIQQHLWGNIDLDGLAERLARGWLATAARREQLELYDSELADRMLYRKQALLSRWLDTQQTKLNLSSKQMQEIERVLNDNWRDRWFRSLEATFSNNSLLPDIKTVWISTILTDAQNAALVARDTQAVYRSFFLSADCPVMELTERYAMGDCRSSEKIAVVPSNERGKPAVGLEELGNDLKE